MLCSVTVIRNSILNYIHTNIHKITIAVIVLSSKVAEK